LVIFCQLKLAVAIKLNSWCWTVLTLVCLTLTTKMNNKTKTPSYLKVVHWNCFKLNPARLEELRLFLVSTKPDIVSLNELKLNEYECNFYLNFEGYNAVFKTRERNPSCGGGVCLLVRDNIPFGQVTLFDDLGLEVVAISTKVDTKNVIVVSYYNPPDKQVDSNLFQRLDESGSEFMICGDLNSKMKCFGCKQDSGNGEILCDILSGSGGIVLYNNKPTYHSYSNREINDVLDYFIVSPFLMERQDSFEVSNESLGSDHRMISLRILLENNHEKARKNKKIRFDFNKANWTSFSNDLSLNVSEEVIEDTDNLNTLIISSILNSANKHIPKSTGNFKFKVPYPAEIVEIIKKRKELRKKTRNGKANELKPEYNRLTKLLNNKIMEFNSKKIEKKIEKCDKLKSSKPMWDAVNSFRKPKKSKNIPSLVHEKRAYESDNEKAELFGNILEKIFNNNWKSNESIEEEVRESMEEEANFQNFEKIEFTLQELNAALKTLSSSAPGVDEVDNLMLKNISNDFKLILLELFNKILITGSFPKSWKIAKIVMIPKKEGYTSNPNEYRPISLTSCLAKLFEKLVHSRLYNFLELQKIILKCQAGFRRSRSTKDHLLFLTQKIQEALSRGKRVCSLFFDIMKAFDSVWHDGLIFKMRKIGVPEYLVRLARNFLSDRYFFVEVNGVKGEMRKMTNGVPQGSILGPLLFLIFINDIPTNDNKPNSAYSFLYADDLASMFIFRQPRKMLAQIKKHLLLIEVWLEKWRFKLSVHKCCYTIFSNNKSYKTRFNFSICKQNIAYNENPVLLGVIFGESNCFEDQVAHIRGKCLNRLNLIKILARKSWKISKKVLLTLYKTLIGSIIDYSSFFLKSLSQANLKKLQAIQNRAVRCIFRLPYVTSTAELCNISKLTSVKDRMESLNKKFFEKGLVNNDWVKQLVEEFKRSRNSLQKETLLHDYVT
jgi:exonuclease III